MAIDLRTARLAWTVAGAVAIGAPVTAAWEGMRTEPYRDITGHLTVCLGETNVPMRPYTEAECFAMFEKSYGKYTRGALECTPGLIGHPFQLAAAADLAYNAGIPNYCKSTARRLFNVGDYAGGCEAITKFVYSKGQWLRGLFNRRMAGDAERASFYQICMTGLETTA